MVDSSLDPLWERVWELKARTLDTMPGKIKSLESVGRKGTQRRDEYSLSRRPTMEPIREKVESVDATRVEPDVPLQEKEPKLKRKARYVCDAWTLAEVLTWSAALSSRLLRTINS